MIDRLRAEVYIFKTKCDRKAQSAVWARVTQVFGAYIKNIKQILAKNKIIKRDW